MKTYIFSPSFKFGVADADLQVIGEEFTIKEEHSARTMWDYFAQTSGKVVHNDTARFGIDRFHFWKKDLEEMKKMGIRHYRTSISMSRILDENGEVNAKAVAWYTSYFKALKKAGISIYATLYHWELPLYLHEQGGWKNRKTADVFVKHAETVVQQLGEYIDEYFLLNEPWCSSLLSYHLGIHAPGETNLASGLLSAHHLLLAEGMAMKAMKSINKNLQIGTVFNVQPSYAASQSDQDRLAAYYADAYFNLWFFDPVFKGSYPQKMVEFYGKNMPAIEKGDMEIIRIGSELSSLGINYYRGDIVKWNDTNEIKCESVMVPEGLTNDLNWPIYLPPQYPSGLYDILCQIYYSYKDDGLKKLYVTENGMAQYTPWNGTTKVIDDSRRVHYLAGHIQQIHDAIQRGIPVEGYFEWTLMDNYEWAEGYRPESCFGMIYVDRKTMKRIWKKSAYWYQGLIQSGKLQVS